MPFFESRTTALPASRHRCTNLDYSEVKAGRIACRDCNNVWRLGLRGWVPSICPGCGYASSRCRHYGARK